MTDLKSALALEKEIEELERQAGIIQQPQPTPPAEDPEVEVIVDKVVEDDNTPVADKEEESFRKRYSDLRRHQQRKEEESRDKIKALEEALSAAKKNPSPTSEEEVLAWVEANPKAAEIIRAVARKEQPKNEVKEVKGELERIRAEAKILKAHPDYEDIVNQSDFHDWAESKPKRIQELIYGSDPDDVIWAINEFKRNTAPTKDSSQVDAAKLVTRGKAAETPGKGPKAFSESQVAAMSPEEYEANEDAIQAAMRAGTFVYDRSAGAR